MAGKPVKLFRKEPLIQDIFDKIVESIPKIDFGIRSFSAGIPVSFRTGKEDFYEKYLKYKNKYLELKNKMKK